MIDCDVCGKRHKNEGLIAKCKQRAERAAARAEKINAERERRVNNLVDTPVTDLIYQVRRLHGQPYEKIVAKLKKDYPPPYQTWGVYEVITEYAKMLNWPIDLDSRVAALCEKHYLGEYITYHPLVGRMVREEHREEVDAHGG